MFFYWSRLSHYPASTKVTCERNGQHSNRNFHDASIAAPLRRAISTMRQVLCAVEQSRSIIFACLRKREACHVSGPQTRSLPRSGDVVRHICNSLPKHREAPLAFIRRCGPASAKLSSLGRFYCLYMYFQETPRSPPVAPRFYTYQSMRPANAKLSLLGCLCFVKIPRDRSISACGDSLSSVDVARKREAVVGRPERRSISSIISLRSSDKRRRS